MGNKNVLLISLSDLDRDPRVKRQYVYFKERGYNVYLMGYKTIEGDPNFSEISFSKSRLSGISNKYNLTTKNYQKVEKIINNRYRYNSELFSKVKFDLIIANDIQSVPIVEDFISENTKLWIDLHEYTPLQHEEIKSWKYFYSPYFYWFTRKYISRGDIITTVTKGLADEYEREFGVEVDAVLFNTPNLRHDLKPQPVDPKKIKFVHHGVASPSRGLEVLIGIMENLDDKYELHLYLMTKMDYRVEYLEKLKAESKEKGTKIIFHEIVPTDKIPEEINQYDAQLMFVAPVNFNYVHGLGNKFFESVQARLAIISGPLESKYYYINKYKIGMSTSSFDPKIIAKEISEMRPDKLQEFKNNTQKVYQELSVEGNYKKMDNILKGKLGWNQLNQSKIKNQTSG